MVSSPARTRSPAPCRQEQGSHRCHLRGCSGRRWTVQPAGVLRPSSTRTTRRPAMVRSPARPRTTSPAPGRQEQCRRAATPAGLPRRSLAQARQALKIATTISSPATCFRRTRRSATRLRVQSPATAVRLRVRASPLVTRASASHLLQRRHGFPPARPQGDQVLYGQGAVFAQRPPRGFFMRRPSARFATTFSSPPTPPSSPRKRLRSTCRPAATCFRVQSPATPVRLGEHSLPVSSSPGLRPLGLLPAPARVRPSVRPRSAKLAATRPATGRAGCATATASSYLVAPITARDYCE